MKLVIAIVNEEDSPNLLDRLGRRGYSATVTGTRGGFLRIGNATIFCGVEDGQVADVLTVFRESCTSPHPICDAPAAGDGTGGDAHPHAGGKTGGRRYDLRCAGRAFREDIGSFWFSVAAATGRPTTKN